MRSGAALTRRLLQGSGYGARALNLLKQHLVEQRIFRVLAFTDDATIRQDSDFFGKQGFSGCISLRIAHYINTIDTYHACEFRECLLQPG